VLSSPIFTGSVDCAAAPMATTLAALIIEVRKNFENISISFLMWA
jgi:hypothetical protein